MLGARDQEKDGELGGARELLGEASGAEKKEKAECLRMRGDV